MSKFKESVEINYRSCIFALAYGVTYEMLDKLLHRALLKEEFEVVEGIKKGLNAHKKSNHEFNCFVKPIMDIDIDENI